MERIICNKKLKKIFMSIIILVLIFNFIYPNMAWAMARFSQPSVSGSIVDIVSSMTTYGNTNFVTILDKISGAKTMEETLKQKVEDAIDTKFPDLEDGMSEKAYHYYKNDKDMILVTCNIGGASTNGYFISGFSVTLGEGLTQEKIETDIGDKTLEEIGEVDTSGGSLPPSSAATGQDPEGDIVVKEGDNGANIGGILLEPLFALVNFIADAIVSNLGRIMTGEGLTLSGVLSTSPQPPDTGEGSAEFMDINTESFLGLFKTQIEYPNIKYTPEEIFAGKIDLLSIDFISGEVFKKDAQGNIVKDENGNALKDTNSNSDWINIRKLISQWYQVLRMIAIIGLLSVLIYTGIKIIISANAKDKAKFKEWIINWLMAVAILFAMHLIMAFIVSVTGEFSLLLNEANQTINVRPSNGEPFGTNLMGLVRFMIQSKNFYTKVGYEIMYIALIIYTIKFTLIYLKRVLSMAFLTLIAPIVALTYPLDKINDGRAQGFDMWLKEYIFNALLQPMHLILYYILVGSAVSVAASNPIYGIAVLMFMTEAEKLLKQIFGFQKASGGTVGSMAGAFAAGALASSIKNIAGKIGSAAAGAEGGDTSPEIDKPKPTDKPGMDTFSDNDTNNLDSGNGNTRRGAEEQDNSEGNADEGKTAQQLMYDADEENGELDDDPAYRETLAREAYGNQNEQNNEDNMDDDEYREYLRENCGFDDETIELAMEQRAKDREAQSNSEQSEGAQPEPQPSEEQSESEDSGQPIREMAEEREAQRQERQSQEQEKKKESRFKKGAKAVGKKLLKPVWDADKSKSYNLKRLGKKAVKGVVKGVGGFALGVTAAAVQAGISITDGKYNPMEGIATMAAGYTGASRLTDRAAKGLGGVIDTYRQGADAGNKERLMQRAKDRFADRDDVIAFNKKEYTKTDKHYTAKDYMEREKDHYLEAGVTDLKEMKKCMKYADAMVGKTDGMSDEQIKAAREKADRKAAATLDFRKTLQDQGQLSAVYDKDKQDKYINSMVEQAQRNGEDTDRVRRQYENAFKSVAAYDSANA